MNLQINCTDEGVVTYPLHNHVDYEIIYYLSGEGYLRTQKSTIPYAPGTIIIVPPYLLHGSTSKAGFKNISINGNFRQLLNFREPVVLYDNEKGEGRLLAELLFANRHSQPVFISSLCETYVLFLLSHLNVDSHMDIAVHEIINEISNHACDSNFHLKAVLQNSGYAEDYIRNQFKLRTNRTPTQFLYEIRIKRACYLIDIYKNSYSMTYIAEQCGFEDYVYFSKRFKQITGMSPRAYKKQALIV